MQISTGPENYKIIDSGSIISFKDEDIKFHLTDSLAIIVSFTVASDINEQKMKFEIINEQEAKLTLTNFNTAAGAGNAEPIQIAKIDGRFVYLNLVVFALAGSLNRTIHYTWYSREEVKNG